MTDRLRYILGIVNEMHDTFLSDQSGFERWLTNHNMFYIQGDFWADSFIDFFVCVTCNFSEKNWRKSYSGYYEIFDQFFGAATHFAVHASVIENFDAFENFVLKIQKEIRKRNTNSKKG